MGCHTWGYMMIKDMTNDEINDIKNLCIEKAESSIKTPMQIQEDFHLYNSIYNDDSLSFSEYKEYVENNNNKALYFLSNIDKNINLLKFYRMYTYYDKKLYLECINPCYDHYIRLRKYTNKQFINPNQLIKYCNSIGWRNLYWVDNGRIIMGNENIKTSKIRIKKMFNEHKNILINFG